MTKSAVNIQAQEVPHINDSKLNELEKGCFGEEKNSRLYGIPNDAELIKASSIDHLSDRELKDLASALTALDEQYKYNRQQFLFPETGPLNRHMYPKVMKFFEAGALYNERALIAGNRTGKTYDCSSEDSWHLNGRYPDWWKGKKFYHPIEAWCCGKTTDTTREILQNVLIGPIHDIGSGMIPKEDITDWVMKPGGGGNLQEVRIKHYTNNRFDGYSRVAWKSYDQGVEAFMGTARHLIHLDEEPPKDIYSECLTRTMTTKGIILCSFTPLFGMTEVVKDFLINGRFPPGGCGPVEEVKDGH